MQETISPLSWVERVIRFWWLIAFFIVLGGLAGWAFSGLRQPVYEVRVEFPVAVDLTRTGEITQFEEDQAIGAAGTIITTEPVLSQVAADAQAIGIQTDAAGLLKIASYERRSYRWVLRVTGTSAQATEKLAQIWSARGWAALLNAQEHAEQAAAIARYQASLTACLENYVPVEPGEVVCANFTFEDLQANLASSGLELAAEKQAAGEMMAGMVIGQPEVSEIPADPVRYGTNSLVLAGMGIGLLAVLVLFATPALERWERIKRYG